MNLPCIIDGPDNGPLFIFAHGAGAPMEHAFMTAVAQGLAKEGIRVVRFNFPYMAKRAEDGKKRPPDRAPKLLEAFSEVIASVTDDPVIIGGKSMGGRMASLLSEHPLVKGIACLGFPFHPPGKPEKFKGEHLQTLSKPTLILQGERDTLVLKLSVSNLSSPQWCVWRFCLTAIIVLNREKVLAIQKPAMCSW